MYFQRFLNLERMKLNKLPDIDIDFPWDRRDDVVEMIFKKYGKEHAAIVGGFCTFQGRSALAEVGKVLGISDRDIRRVTEHLPHTGATGIKEALDSGIESRGAVYNDEPYTTAMELAAILDGFPRYPKMHPCGVVISRDPIRDLSPTFPSAKNPAWPVTHFNMEACEQVGLVKLDILAQAGLSVMRDTVRELKDKGISGRSVVPGAVGRSADMGDDLERRGARRPPHRVPSHVRVVSGLSAARHRRAGGDRLASSGRAPPMVAGRLPSRPAPAASSQSNTCIRLWRSACDRPYGVVAYEEHVPQICEAFAGMAPGQGRRSAPRAGQAQPEGDRRDEGRVRAVGDRDRTDSPRRSPMSGDY